MARVQLGLPGLPASPRPPDSVPPTLLETFVSLQYLVVLFSIVTQSAVDGVDVSAWLQVFSAAAAALCGRCEIAGTDTQTNEVDSHETRASRRRERLHLLVDVFTQQWLYAYK